VFEKRHGTAGSGERACKAHFATVEKNETQKCTQFASGPVWVAQVRKMDGEIPKSED
jgi:hypothetical protein